MATVRDDIDSFSRGSPPLTQPLGLCSMSQSRSRGLWPCRGAATTLMVAVAQFRSEPDLAHQLITLPVAAAVAGRLSHQLMQKPTSSWTHRMMFARSALFVDQKAYQFGLLPPPVYTARWPPPAAVPCCFSLCLLLGRDDGGHRSSHV